jgi:hypothetical protein
MKELQEPFITEKRLIKEMKVQTIMSSYQDIKYSETIFLKSSVQPISKGFYDRNLRNKWTRLRACAKLRTLFKFKPINLN